MIAITLPTQAAGPPCQMGLRAVADAPAALQPQVDARLSPPLFLLSNPPLLRWVPLGSCPHQETSGGDGALCRGTRSTFSVTRTGSEHFSCGYHTLNVKMVRRPLVRPARLSYQEAGVMSCCPGRPRHSAGHTGRRHLTCSPGEPMAAALQAFISTCNETLTISAFL